jgi:sorbitol-specific phosphotransferase system component IIBC
MRLIIKILLSIVILCGGSAIAQLIAQAMGNRVSTGGIGPFIIYPAIIAGIWAVWKYNPEKINDDKHNLKKD